MCELSAGVKLCGVLGTVVLGDVRLSSGNRVVGVALCISSARSF